MKVSLNGLINQINGRIGNLVAFAGRTSNIVRQIVVPMNPQSATQVASRALVAYFSALWRTLAEADIVAWNLAAGEQQHTDAVGSKYLMDGFNFFLAVNCRQRFFVPAGVDVTVPPALTAPAVNANIDNLDATAGPSVLLVDIPLISAGDVLALEATQQVSAGISNFKGRFRPIKIFPAGAALANEDVTTEYEAVFGTLVQNRKIAMRCQFYNLAGNPYRKYFGGPELSGKVK